MSLRKVLINVNFQPHSGASAADDFCSISFESTTLIECQLQSKLLITDAWRNLSRRAVGPSPVLQMSRQQSGEVSG